MIKLKKATMALVAILFTATTYAQTPQRVYDQIYRSSYKVASDKSEDTEIRKIASFKVDAISYLKTKTLEALSASDKELTGKDIAHLNSQLDSMAYYMYDFVNLYLKNYAKAGNEKEKNRVRKIFRDASINHPLYGDKDEEVVLAYYNRDDYPTQFSLDTNWIAALEEVKKELK